MKAYVVPAAAALALFACTSSDLDEASQSGTADHKDLTRPDAMPPSSGVMPIRNRQPLRSSVTSSAPASANLTYYGGNLINHATYTNVFWGGYWSTNSTGLSERTTLDNFMKTVGPSPEFASVLTQYAQPGKPIGAGVYQGDKQIATEPGAKIDDSAIKTTIQSWIDAGLVPAPSPDQIYVLNFPPGTQITIGPDASCTNFCGYHSTINTSSGAGGLIRYIVNPYPSCGGCQSESTVMDSSTVVLSHEMAETVTDPDVGLATTLGPPLGWYDSANGEIGDICAGDPNATMLGYRVHAEWSNADKKCVASRPGGNPNPDFSLTVAPPSQSVVQGGSTSFIVAVNPSGGFTGSVSFSVSGLPSGASGSFSGNTLNISTTASAAAGASTLTITGTSASLSHSASVGLTVKAPPPPGVVFFDDVEHGNIGWTTYAQHPGDPLWAIEATSSGHRWRSNPGRNYANDTATFLISPAFSLAGFSKATLAFLYKFHTEDWYDNFYVWASGDNGRSWTQIATGSGVSLDWNHWAPPASLSLSSFAGKDKVRIAFSLQSDFSVTDWGVAIDDISVTAQ